MKNGKILLGVASLVITLTSALAFTTQAKARNNGNIWTKSTSAGCEPVTTCNTNGIGSAHECAIGITVYTTNQCSTPWTGQTRIVD
jgi:hypothetical protein